MFSASRKFWSVHFAVKLASLPDDEEREHFARLIFTKFIFHLSSTVLSVLTSLYLYIKLL